MGYRRIGIGQCPIIFRALYFSTKKHAIFAINVETSKKIEITFGTTTVAVVVRSTSNFVGTQITSNLFLTV